MYAIRSYYAAIVLLSSLRISATYAYYYLDTAGFIERLCENKDKPEMHCNGNCHLKKVVENNTEDSTIPFKDIDYKEILLYVVITSYSIHYTKLYDIIKLFYLFLQDFRDIKASC